MAKTINLRKASVASLKKQQAALSQAVQAPDTFLRASYVKQYLTCGKKNCRCHRGFKHGPFFYLVQSLGVGNTRKFLLKTPAQRKQARAAIAAHHKLQQQLAEHSAINTELVRRSAA